MQYILLDDIIFVRSGIAFLYFFFDDEKENVDVYNKKRWRRQTCLKEMFYKGGGRNFFLICGARTRDGMIKMRCCSSNDVLMEHSTETSQSRRLWPIHSWFVKQWNVSVYPWIMSKYTRSKNRIKLLMYVRYIFSNCVYSGHFAIDCNLKGWFRVHSCWSALLSFCL